MAVFVAAGLVSSARSAGEPTITSDKDDYPPGATVTLTGSNWGAAGSSVDLFINDDAGQTWSHTTDVPADDSGGFSYQFNLRFAFRGRVHGAGDRHLSLGDSVTVTHTFTGANDQLEQCGNGGVGDPPITCAGSAWQHGNLNDNQAHYNEGDSVPYRLTMEGLSTGATTHTATIAWDTTDNGKHGIDYLTSFNRTETTADPCSDVYGPDPCPAFDTEPIPDDVRVTNGPDNLSGTLATDADNITQADGDFRLYGGNITAVSGYSLDSGSYANGTGYSNGSITKITITFTTTVSNPVLAWGGHISKRQEWAPEPTAATFSGSPMRLKEVDGKGGNQDRSLSSDAVISPATLQDHQERQPAGQHLVPVYHQRRQWHRRPHSVDLLASR